MIMFTHPVHRQLSQTYRTTDCVHSACFWIWLQIYSETHLSILTLPQSIAPALICSNLFSNPLWYLFISIMCESSTHSPLVADDFGKGLAVFLSAQCCSYSQELRVSRAQSVQHPGLLISWPSHISNVFFHSVSSMPLFYNMSYFDLDLCQWTERVLINVIARLVGLTPMIQPHLPGSHHVLETLTLCYLVPLLGLLLFSSYL